jgi:NitT/TauT family transport system ATP-binding protein
MAVAPLKIDLRRVRKEFARSRDGALVVLEGIDLELEALSFTSVIGASGSGKTTLLQLIAGLQFPTSGEVIVDAVPVKGPGRDRAVVFQDDAIFPWRTVLGNVEYGLSLRRMSKAERRQRAQEFIRLVGLTGFEEYYPYQLSGGMKKRVALAEVLAVRPNVLLLDEPFGALDYVTRRQLQEELVQIWQSQELTSVMVTHDIEEALYLSDRIVVLRDAKLHRDLIVPFSRPRVEGMRKSPEFVELKEKLWEDIGAGGPSGPGEPGLEAHQAESSRSVRASVQRDLEGPTTTRGPAWPR